VPVLNMFKNLSFNFTGPVFLRDEEEGNAIFECGMFLCKHKYSINFAKYLFLFQFLLA